MSNLRDYARLLGGDIAGGQIVFPPPGHTKRDRSAILKFVEGAPDGFLIHSFAGDDPTLIRDYVKERLGLTSAKPMRMLLPSSTPIRTCADKGQVARALAIWCEAHDPRGTPVEIYLHDRKLALPDEAVAEAIRFHPSCPFAENRTPAMVCLVRDIVTNAPKAIHRTALTRDGHKLKIAGFDRLSLGPIGGGAIKITPNESVTVCLGIGEGIESTLSLRNIPNFGPSPIWALISAGGVKSLPVLAGVESLWVAVDHDQTGITAARSTAHRWQASGAEAFLITPSAHGLDLNDLLTAGLRHA